MLQGMCTTGGWGIPVVKFNYFKFLNANFNNIGGGGGGGGTSLVLIVPLPGSAFDYNYTNCTLAICKHALNYICAEIP